MYGLKPIPTFPVKPHSANEIYGTAEVVPFVERAFPSSLGARVFVERAVGSGAKT
jgi:hypothetical protein